MPQTLKHVVLSAEQIVYEKLSFSAVMIGGGDGGGGGGCVYIRTDD
jgi:hypothetical protein